MERILLAHLKTWLSSQNRKPLVIRGARQVGKTWLIRQLAKEAGKQLIEINFEKNISHASLFASNDPQQILLNLSAAFNKKIEINNCLLFLDEIQAAPQLFSKLRWFAEDLPQLPVVAAGSLLEFVLDDHSFSMPVGRISYMHLEPLSFEEFLLANDKETLVNYLAEFNFSVDVPAAIHEQLMLFFKEYMLVGGLPAVVVSWISERSLNSIHQIQNDLLATYRDDFAKFRGRIAIERLDEVVMAIPKMLGEKFVFSRVNARIQPNTIKNVLDLLAKARICHPIWSCSANGIPLAAEINEKYFKEVFLDIGLCNAALGVGLNQIYAASEINMINNGAVAEQVVGQLLRNCQI
jgi:predicted AAA+ superfamily ATPase